MLSTPQLAIARTIEFLNGDAVLATRVSQLAEESAIELPPLRQTQIRAGNISAELADRSGSNHYPTFQVYCERISNQMKEKFRTFSGKIHLVIEVRSSHDRLEEVENRTRICVEAVVATLSGTRGDWGDGLFYSGGYDIQYGPVKHGGRNFLQVAKVSIELDGSID
jgi:hypothetical protein